MTLTEFLLARLEEEILVDWGRAVTDEIERGTVSESDKRELAAVYADHADYREEWRATRPAWV